MRNCSLIEAVRVICMGIKEGILTAYGVLKLARLQGPIITVFGGEGAFQEGKYVQATKELAHRSAQAGMAIITGGGPGIMEAANCGAVEDLAIKPERVTLGIGVWGVDEGFKNTCTSIIHTNYFFSRKWLLIRYSSAFIFFPGGIGTMDEFFEVLNLMKLKKMDKVPIILFSSNYWRSLIEWYQHAVEYEFIMLQQEQAFTVVDTVDEAMHVIMSLTKPKGES